MRSQDGDKRPGRKGSTRWTCQTRPASPAQPCWSASAPFLINFYTFSDQILLLFWSNFTPTLINVHSLLCEFPYAYQELVNSADSTSMKMQFHLSSVPQVFVCFPMVQFHMSNVLPQVFACFTSIGFVCFATFNISLLSSLVARTSRWKLKVVHQPSFLFLEKNLVLCYLERKLVTQYLVYNLPKDLSEFCSLAKK